jgi:hypothetical protein
VRLGERLEEGGGTIMKMRHILAAAVALVMGAATAHAQLIPFQQVPVVTSGVPAVAAAAGFTKLAQSWDFSQPLYAVQSNWYDCSGTDFSNPAQTFHQGNPGVPLYNPCNINQVNDGGTLVMDYQYLTSYEGHGYSGQSNQVGGETTNVQGDHVSVDFPNMYIETVARITSTFGSPANSGGPNDVWTWSDPSSACPIEIDVFELYADQGGFGNGSAHAWCTGVEAYHWYSYRANNLPPGWKPTDYHKYGTLLTSDGSTEIYACGFVDDRLQGCGGLNASSAPAMFTGRNRVIISAGSNSATAAANIDMNVKYVNVYSCDSWATGMCNGATKTTDANGVTYWAPSAPPPPPPPPPPPAVHVVQGAQYGWGNCGSSFTYTLPTPVQPGSAIMGAFLWEAPSGCNGGSPDVVTLGSQQATELPIIWPNNFGAGYCCPQATPFVLFNVAGSQSTFTIKSSNGGTFRPPVGELVEVSGLSSTASVDQFIGNFEKPSAGFGSTPLTSGSITPSQAGDFNYGFAVTTYANAGSITPGTGWTSGPNQGACSDPSCPGTGHYNSDEYILNYGSTSPIAATFGSNGSGETEIGIIAIKP